MELQGLKLSKYSYAVKARRMLSYLRGVASIAIRKSFGSKQKLLMDMSLLMKRSKCLLSLLLHRHHRPDRMPALGAWPRVCHEYEFSCSNSPNLLFHHTKRRCSCFFPCLHLAVDEVPEEHILRPPAEVVQAKIVRSPLDDYLAPEQRRRRSCRPTSSPGSAGRFSDCSLGDDDGGGASGLSQEVDDEAEEFIRRFYEELRVECQVAVPLRKQ